MHGQSQQKSCKLFATRKPVYLLTVSHQNEISAPTLQRVFCKGVLCVHFHFKDFLPDSSFATVNNTFLFGFVQGFLPVEAKLLPLGCSAARSPGIGLLSQNRERRKREKKWDKASVPGEANFLLPQGHCCSSITDLSGLCTLWAPKGSSQLGSLGSDLGSGVTALLISHILLH